MNVVSFEPQRGDSLEDGLDDMNRAHAVIQWNSQTLIMRETMDGERKKISFMNKDGFLLWNENNIFWERTIVNGQEKNTKIKIARAWLEWKKRRQYEEIVFNPSGVVVPKVYNLWSGFSYKPKEGGKFDIFLDHLRVNICGENEENYQWLLSWIADLFQKPDRKLGTSLVMRGKMGVGKGVVANHIGALIKRHFLAVNKAEHVTGRFNGHLAGTLLLFLDEAFWAGDKQAEGTLKSLITENDIPIEMKGKDVYTIRSYLRIIISTNNDWAVPTGMKDERRFAIFDVGEGCRENKKYFGDMKKQLEDGGYEGLLHFFLNFKYDPIKAAQIPQTEALLDQKFHALTPELRWWYNCLSDERIGSIDPWGFILKRDEFYNAYIEFCKQSNIRHPLDKKWLARRLQDRVPFKVGKDTRGMDGWQYRVDTLENCRLNFETMIGHKLEWES